MSRENLVENAKRGELVAAVACFVAFVVVSFLLLLLAGCRAASSDIRESLPLLQERVEAYIEFSAPRPEADEEEREARAALEARIKEQLSDLTTRMAD